MEFFWSKYSEVELENTLHERFADLHLSAALTTVVVPAYDTTRSKMHVFSSYEAGKDPEKDFLMKSVGRATSAAPTFFPIAKIKGNDSNTYHLVDGGIVANNPTLLAYAQARKIFPNADDFLIVSLGTGARTVGFTRYDELKGAGFWRWARRIPSLMINASSHSVDYHVDIFMSEFKHALSERNPRYYRLQTELPPDLAAMDSTQKYKITDLETYGEKLVSGYKVALTSIIQELSTPWTYASPTDKLIPGIHLNQGGIQYLNKETLREMVNKEVTSRFAENAYFDPDEAKKFLADMPGIRPINGRRRPEDTDY